LSKTLAKFILDNRLGTISDKRQPILEGKPVLDYSTHLWSLTGFVQILALLPFDVKKFSATFAKCS
jgi:hypothetical protein